MEWLRPNRHRYAWLMACVAAAIITLGCASPSTDTQDEAQRPGPSETIPSTFPTPPTDAPPTSPGLSAVSLSSTPTTLTAPPTPCEVLSRLDSEQMAGYWFIVNDGVMGGRSSSNVTFTGDQMSWSGEIDTNGGGFASLRAGLAPGVLASSGAVRVAARHDGRAYELLLGAPSSRVTYYGALRFGEPDAAGISIARVDFDTLEARIFGTGVEAGPFRADLAATIGVILADGTDGSFALDLVRIDRCTA